MTAALITEQHGLYGDGQFIVETDARDADGVERSGYLAWCSGGGNGESEAYDLGAHGVPPVTLPVVHKTTFASASFDNFVQLPIWIPANFQLTALIFCQKSKTGMTVTPYAKVIDLNKSWGEDGEALSTAAMADDLNWQTLRLTYQPTAGRTVGLRVGGRDASATMYWGFQLGVITGVRVILMTGEL